MSILALTTGAQTVSATGALTPTAGVDISTYGTGTTAKPVTVCIECIQLTAAKTISVGLTVSTNAFTASAVAHVFQFAGQVGEAGTTFTAGDYTPSTNKRSVVVRQTLPFTAANYFGAVSSKARLEVLGIDAATGATFNAWLE